MLSIPILRHGNEYVSLDVARTKHHQTREPFVEISQANAGLIRRDLGQQDIGTASLQRFSTRDLVSICWRAAEHFTNDALPLVAPPPPPPSPTPPPPPPLLNPNCGRLRSSGLRDPRSAPRSRTPQHAQD